MQGGGGLVKVSRVQAMAPPAYKVPKSGSATETLKFPVQYGLGVAEKFVHSVSQGD